ncbi:MAG: UvrD-helicase domain-containing protein [bacterium]
MKPEIKKPPDQSQRELILRELETTMLVEAAAGTGKTTSMVGRMVALLASGKCSADRMAAITFTRKAAAELRSRFRLELEKRAREEKGAAKERVAEALGKIERCSIMTIHSFCAGLLRERPIEAGLAVDFEELEPEADNRLREDAWNEHVATLYAENDPILDELNGLGLEISDLKPAFMRIADYPDVEEWPAPSEPPPELAPVAEALKKYAAHREKLSRKFGDPGNDRLMPKYRLIPRLSRYGDLSRPAELMAIMETMGGDPNIVQKNWPGGRETALKEKEQWAEFGERYAESFKNSVLARRYEAAMRAVRPALDFYEASKLESGRLNYQDLLMHSARLLRGRPNVRRYFRGRFSHILVDEFQDTDPVQAEVMLLLTSDNPAETDWRKCRPAPGSLFVVGDPKQSIYRFRRADIVTYNRVRRIIGESGGMVVDLQANFRTAAPLVKWANATFDNVFPAEADAYSPPKREMLVGRTDALEANLAGVKRTAIPDSLKNKNEVLEYEADLIARTIRRALDEGLTVPRTQRERERGAGPEARPGDFLVITRNTANLSAYARKLREYDIPHQVSGGSALNQVAQLALLHTCLAAVVRPENPVALVAALRSELFGASDAQLYDYMKAGGEFSFRPKTLTNIKDIDRDVFHDAFKKQLSKELSEGIDFIIDAFWKLWNYSSWFNKLPPVAAVEKIVTDTGLLALAAAGPGGNEQAGSMGKALEILRSEQTEMRTAPDIADYLGRIVARKEKYDGIPASPPEADVVRVMNLHKVKGLEAPIVFLANPTDHSEHPVEIHIDRSGDTVRGYIAIHAETAGYGSGKPLAMPRNWDELAAEEKKFDEAEKMRLLYVAATRAGAMLSIVTRDKYRNRNSWDFFGGFVEDAPALEDPGERKRVVSEKININSADINAAIEEIKKRWNHSLKSTCASEEAKKYALQGKKIPAAGAGLGPKWGKTIHKLLKVAAEKPEAGLRHIAISSLHEQYEQEELAEYGTSLVDAVIKTVRSVQESNVWKRAKESEMAFYEIPIVTILQDTKKRGDFPEILLNGEIDLVFKENGKWVIVDYKTGDTHDNIERLFDDYYIDQVRIYKEMWQKCTNETVGEIGVFFVNTGIYMKEHV